MGVAEGGGVGEAAEGGEVAGEEREGEAGQVEGHPQCGRDGGARDEHEEKEVCEEASQGRLRVEVVTLPLPPGGPPLQVAVLVKHPHHVVPCAEQLGVCVHARLLGGVLQLAQADAERGRYRGARAGPAQVQRVCIVARTCVDAAVVEERLHFEEAERRLHLQALRRDGDVEEMGERHDAADED